MERYNRTVGYDWLPQSLFATMAEVQGAATAWLWICNTERPNMALRGIMPSRKLARAALLHDWRPVVSGAFPAYDQ